MYLSKEDKAIIKAMIIAELSDEFDEEEEEEEETREVECPACKGIGMVLIATGYEVSCETCEGTGLLTESED